MIGGFLFRTCAPRSNLARVRACAYARVFLVQATSSAAAGMTAGVAAALSVGAPGGGALGPAGALHPRSHPLTAAAPSAHNSAGAASALGVGSLGVSVDPLLRVFDAGAPQVTCARALGKEDMRCGKVVTKMRALVPCRGRKDYLWSALEGCGSSKHSLASGMVASLLDRPGHDITAATLTHPPLPKEEK